MAQLELKLGLPVLIAELILKPGRQFYKFFQVSQAAALSIPILNFD
jgi:hypothetical protein